MSTVTSEINVGDKVTVKEDSGRTPSQLWGKTFEVVTPTDAGVDAGVLLDITGTLQGTGGPELGWTHDLHPGKRLWWVMRECVEKTTPAAPEVVKGARYRVTNPARYRDTLVTVLRVGEVVTMFSDCKDGDEEVLVKRDADDTTVYVLLTGLERVTEDTTPEPVVDKDARIAELERELAAVQRNVEDRVEQARHDVRQGITDYISSIREEKGWCVEGTNGHLQRMGCPTIDESKEYSVTVTVEYEITIKSEDGCEPSEYDIRRNVERLMDSSEILMDVCYEDYWGSSTSVRVDVTED